MNKEQVYNDLLSSYTALLKQNAPKSSGALASSITGEINGDNISFSMLSYGTILDKGINGTERNNGSPYSFTNKKPPISSLMGYAKMSGINPYVLQNSIYKKGFKPQEFLENDKEIDNLATNIAESLFDEFAENN